MKSLREFFCKIGFHAWRMTEMGFGFGSHDVYECQRCGREKAYCNA